MLRLALNGWVWLTIVAICLLFLSGCSSQIDDVDTFCASDKNCPDGQVCNLASSACEELRSGDDTPTPEPSNNENDDSSDNVIPTPTENDEQPANNAANNTPSAPRPEPQDDENNTPNNDQSDSCAAQCGKGERCIDGQCLVSIVQIDSGHKHVCAVRTDERVVCWGNNERGQLGIGTTTNQATPRLVSDLHGVENIVVADEHVFAMTTQGEVYSWGWNEHGQLGLGNTDDQLSPVILEAFGTVTPSFSQIAAGFFHSCVLSSDGAVWCVGDNSFGQLGNGKQVNSLNLERVEGLSGVVELATGRAHTCALRNDGTVWCWGKNRHGQLGNGNTEHQSLPVRVLELDNVARLSDGIARGHTCAILNDGTAKCWGWNSYGVLGDGGCDGSCIGFDSQPMPVSVNEITNIKQISTGHQFACALLEDGTVWCWGENSAGQLGNGTTTIQQPQLIPEKVLDLSNVSQLAAGSSHICALLDDGRVKCWGRNSSGELGDGTLTLSNTPVEVAF